MTWTDRLLILAGVVLTIGTGGGALAAASPEPPPECASTAAPHPFHLASAALERLDAAARRAVADGEVPGLAVGVVRQGRLVFSRGFGSADLEQGTRITPDTVFRIFSVTKVFTAAAIMQLVERGQLGLDDPLARFLPAFPRADEVTVRHLLSHSSGIHEYAGSSPVLERMGATPEDLVRHIAAQPVPFDFAPGTRWSYSNSNYVLLGLIVERVTGRSYGEYLAAHVFSPAGLGRTRVDDGIDLVRGRASGYVPALGRRGAFVHGPPLDMSFVYAAGALLSTVPELSAWFTAFFDGRIVSPRTVASMLAPARLRDGSIAGPPGEAAFYGLGIRSYCLDGQRAIGPSGSFSSFSAKVTYYPRAELMLIVLTNTGGKAAELEERFARTIFTGGTDRAERPARSSAPRCESCPARAPRQPFEPNARTSTDR
ncbi:CubicO group peptidase, beta-lactamase class C family [Nannocystis exedens]|uniref:CubicO group peptidase, beta-lactamase class C family n=1 Tax=Nannocystis exedens TaxID=54 RepID=A0A1I2IMA6_9BACT|nr:serine hydrolase domain-containing protein [Nannocystis exedens]PCC68147.1 putative penicillin-binding protein PbpX [Nannocystis exedens]SFF43479.1 CubicO group peptidase, beta-lactamase class C family [Nannocystis exedens]